jgi:hypothetical protein
MSFNILYEIYDTDILNRLVFIYVNFKVFL